MPCKYCDGQHHVLSKGEKTTIWIRGNVLGCSTSNEDNMTLIKICPYCGRDIQDMGGLEKNAPRYKRDHK